MSRENEFPVLARNLVNAVLASVIKLLGHSFNVVDISDAREVAPNGHLIPFSRFLYTTIIAYYFTTCTRKTSKEHPLSVTFFHCSERRA